MKRPRRSCDAKRITLHRSAHVEGLPASVQAAFDLVHDDLQRLPSRPRCLASLLEPLRSLASRVETHRWQLALRVVLTRGRGGVRGALSVVREQNAGGGVAVLAGVTDCALGGGCSR